MSVLHQYISVFYCSACLRSQQSKITLQRSVIVRHLIDVSHDIGYDGFVSHLLPSTSGSERYLLVTFTMHSESRGLIVISHPHISPTFGVTCQSLKRVLSLTRKLKLGINFLQPLVVLRDFWFKQIRRKGVCAIYKCEVNNCMYKCMYICPMYSQN